MDEKSTSVIIENVGNIIENVIAGVIVAVIIAFCGFLFRTRIRKWFVGSDLLAVGNLPDIEIMDRQFSTDQKYIGEVVFLLTNTGSISLSKIRMFKCYTENAGFSTSLVIWPLHFAKQYSNICAQYGEMVQIAVDSWYFGEDEWYPDYRLFIELTDQDGTLFRATVIRTQNEGFFVDSNRRVDKSLPNRFLQVKNSSQLLKIASKYDLDLAVG